MFVWFREKPCKPRFQELEFDSLVGEEEIGGKSIPLFADADIDISSSWEPAVKVGQLLSFEMGVHIERGAVVVVEANTTRDREGNEESQNNSQSKIHYED